MGFFSKVGKAVKKVKNTIIGTVIGYATGGPAGAAAGALSGYGQDRAERAQENAMDAQLAAAQRLADAQNPANVVSSVTPTAGMENAQISEESMAADAKRRYSFGKALYKRNLLGRTQGGNITKQILG